MLKWKNKSTTIKWYECIVKKIHLNSEVDKREAF
jgi:hypothetical protein